MCRYITILSILLSFSLTGQINELWNMRYNAAASGIDQPVDMVIDATGSSYVTGISFNGSDFDVITVKYSSSGTLLWTNTYGGSGLDEPRAITRDNSGNIVVVGSRFVSGSDYDIFTLKINATSGAQIWQQMYTGSGLFDLGNDVVIDASNNVYVAGTYYQSTNNLDYIVLKYSASGTFQWANSGGSSTRADEGLLIDIDNSGNVILGGTAEFTTNTTFFDFRVMKISNSGTTTWTLTEDSGFGKLDKPRAMALDASGNVYIGGSGFSTVSNLEDMLLMKVSSGGALLWKNLHSGSSQANDFIAALTVNPTNSNVYVTGKTKSVLNAEDFHTRAYSSAGALLWAQTHSSGGNNFDEATDIKLNNNFLYVTGYSTVTGEGTNFTTLKYDLLGNEEWKTNFNHTTNQSDKAFKLAVDSQQNIIVTGSSFGTSATNLDYATIKYCQLETVASADTAICIGSSTPLTATATGGFNYIWNVVNGSANSLSCTSCQSPIATPTVTTTYAVRSENTIGCIDFDTVTVIVNQAIQPVITASPSLSFCIGSSTSLNVNNQSYLSYLWTNGDTVAQTSISTPGQQIVTIIDANGCAGSDTVTTIQNSLPVVDAGASQSICEGQTAQLQAAGASTYLWLGSPSLSQFIIGNPVASPTNTQTYFVTGTDVNGCTATDSITITVNPLPNISTNGGGIICIGESLVLTANGGISYVWNNTAFLSNENIANPTATPTQTTNFTVTGTDANGCQSQASSNIIVNALPVISAGVNQTICLGDSVNLFATGGSTFTWQPNPAISNLNIASPWVSPVITTDFIVTGTNTNGCSNSDTTTVNVNSLPNVSAGADTEVCLFESTTLNASGAASYSWTPHPTLSGINVSNPTVQPVTATTYFVTGTNSNGCSATDQVEVFVNQLPNINAGANTSVCIGESVQLNATGGNTFVWNFDASLSALNIADPLASPTVNTTYTVTGTDANGCENTDNILVTINALPTIFAGNDFSICAGETAQLQASGGNTYIWDSSPNLSVVNIFNPQTDPLQSSQWFYVTGFNSNNCSNRDSVRITVDQLPSPPVLSDTFPNIVSSYVFGNNWFFNGNFNSSLVNDTINYVDLGNLGTYSATHTDFNGCTSLLSNEIVITKLIYDVSVPEYDFSTVNFKVYPNPVVNSNLSIELFEMANSIAIKDISGKLVYRTVDAQVGIHLVDMIDFESGLYIVTVQANNSIKSVKVIKQN